MDRTLTWVMPGPLAAGRLLLGHHRVSGTIQVRRVRVEAKTLPGSGSVSAGLTRISLEADGVATGLIVEVVRTGGAGETANRTVFTQVTLAAGAELRWRCVLSPAEDEDGLENWVVTAMYDEPGVETRPAAVLTVRWRNGQEDTLLYNYDAASGLFVEAASGVSSGRATVAGGANFGVTFASSGGVMAARPDGLQVGTLIDNKGTATAENARLEFWIATPAGGAQRVATLTEGGALRVLKASEIADQVDMPLGNDRFVLRSGGQAQAVIGQSGVGLVVTSLFELAGAPRETEEGDERVTEEGDVRVTEGG